MIWKNCEYLDDKQNNDKIHMEGIHDTNDTDDTDTDTDTDDLSSNDESESSENSDKKEEEEEKEEEVIEALLEARQIHTNHPPSITIEDAVLDICFHPKNDIIAVASVTGDIFLYKYNNEETNCISNIEVHTRACRDIEFSEDGQLLFSTGKDLSIMITDTETEKLTRFYENAHEHPIYTMTIINENMFATGDDDGMIKLWDFRQRNNDPIFSIKKVEDYISAMVTNRDMKYLTCTSGDGYLTTINMRERKLHVQSEEYDEDLTCLGLFKSERKLLSATSKGIMYMYNWGEFGLHSDKFPSATKKAINCMVPITETIVITGNEDGILRAISLFPHVELGIVGQDNLSIEAIDINNHGNLLASTSYNNIKFWNIEYFETLNVNDCMKPGKQRLTHNFPSSSFCNVADFFANM